MAFNSTTKSSRTLQSRRYTTTGANDFNDAFTQVFDLSTAEIYDQANLLPTSSLPYSGSSQGGSILKGSDGITNIAEYYYRLQLSPINVDESGRYTTWFTISPATSSGVRGDEIQPGQLTNWVSNKYITPTLAGNTAESSPVPGYNVYVSDSSGNLILASRYQFDYKTGTLVFLDASTSPSTPIYLSGYRYLGRTLADNKTLGYSGSFSGSFQGNGSGLTNIPASGIVGLNLTQIATTNVTASVSEGSTSFTLTNTGTPLLTVDNTGKIITSNSASFRDTTITGSLLVTQNFTVLGTASFNTITGSEIVIGSSTITLSTDDPVVRFGGILVIDSGSFGTNSTGSLLWDSEEDRWIYVTPSGSAEGYNSAILIGGPPNTGSVGSEPGLTIGRIMKAVGDDHIGSSLMRETGSVVSVDGSLKTSGSLEVTGSAIFTDGVSGSFSGSFQGNGNGLTNIPASGIVGLNLTQIADSNISASVSSTGTPFRVIDGATSLFEVNSSGGITTYSTSSLKDVNITGLTTISSRLQVANNATITGSTILSGSVNINGSTNIVGTTIITGSTLLATPAAINVTASVREGEYALATSQSAWFYNHNTGVPRSNAWKSNLNGSYFNNFDSNTNVSEILRFIAGLLSASAPDASPNTRYYNSINNNSPSLNISSIAGYVPQDISGSTILYLNSKGFADTGSTIFNGVGSVYTTLNPTYTFTSVADGSTNVSSSADSQLFGLGALGVAFNVSGNLNWRFDDNIAQTVTATSSSQTLLTSPTTGLTVATINTSNPAVIPNAYQDGKFNNIFGMTFYNGGISLTSVSASGWYHVSASIGIQSGSSVYSGFKNNFTKVFAAPISNIESSILTQTITFTQSVTPLTATSRSLSGAPYLQTATWNFQVTSSGVFEPLYFGNSTIFNITDDSTLVTPTGTSTQLMSGGTISGTSLIYNSTGTTQRTSGIPFRTDRIQTSLTETFTAGTTDENINQTGLGTTLYTVTSTSYNRGGIPSSSITNILFHSASTFGQPLSSGSMAYYGRAQGGDNSSLTGTSEDFSGETNRIQVSSSGFKVTAFNGAAWDTNFGLYNLGDKELQIKPGYLVKPGGSYGYWLTNPSSTSDFKYYIRRFQRTSNVSSIRFTINQDLTALWSDTSGTNTIAMAVIFESAKSGSSLISSGDCRIYDIAQGGGATGTTYSTGTDGTNPFESPLVYYRAGSKPLSTTGIYDVAISNANGIYMDGSSASDEFYVVVRYKGDPTPLTGITLTYSS
jgi:hypothetical protein